MRLSKTKKRPFTQVDNKPLNEQMSFQAKGLLVYLLSKPDDWEIRTNHLINQSGEKETKSGKVIPKNGRDAIRSMFAELIEFGYARIENNKDETGRFIGKIYRITEVAFCFEDEYATEDGISGDGKTDYGKTDAGKTPYIVSTEKNQVLKETNTESSSLPTASKKIERTESGSVDVKSLKTRIAEEAPPVPAAPPNDPPPPPYEPGETPEAYIVRMTDPGPNSIEMDRWKVKHGLTYELIREEIERFADKYLVREFPDMDESQVMQALTGKNQASFMRIFRSSFLPRIKSNPVTSNHQPHANSQQPQNSQQPRNSEPSRRKSQRELLADLYPDVAAELYGDIAPGVDGRNPEPASHAHWREA